MIARRRFEILDECGDPPVFRAADANALLDPEQFVRASVGPRFRIRDVDGVVTGDENAARPPELTPLVEEPALLIENLNPVVFAIADKQTARRIDRDRVRLAELAAAGSLSPPFLDEPAVPGEFHDAIVQAVAVTVGDENVAARGNDDVGGLI